MASHVVVIDTTFRRTTIKVTPGSFMSDVLEEACRKLNLKSSNYGLKNNNKAVDVSRTFRQTGLSSGAKLELVVASRSPSVVSVALQIPQPEAKHIPGGRLTHKFPSTTTLWFLLRAFESDEGRNLNFTGRGIAQTADGASGAGRIFYEAPMLNINGRDLSSFEDLQKTLSQLGVNSGSYLIRLSFKTTEIPLEKAMVDIGQYFKLPAADAGPQSAHDSHEASPEGTISQPPWTAAENTITDGAIQTSTPASEADLLMPDTSGDLRKDQAAIKGQAVNESFIQGPSQRPVRVYAPPSSDTPKAALASHNESDYEPTIAHATLHQQRLSARSQNQRLPSDAEAQATAAGKAAKQAAITHVSIKVRFPDQSSVVAEFTREDTGSSFHQHVRGMMAADDQPFVLVWMSPKGPRVVPDDPKKHLIKDLGFSGRLLVNVNWGDRASEDARKAPILKAQYAEQAQDLLIQDFAAAQAQESKVVDDKKEESKKSSGAKDRNGMPKWFKALGKK